MFGKVRLYNQANRPCEFFPGLSCLARPPAYFPDEDRSQHTIRLGFSSIGRSGWGIRCERCGEAGDVLRCGFVTEFVQQT
jgi:hypothetical protein